MRTQSVKFDFNDIGDNPSRAQISDSCKTLSFYLRVDDTALLRGSLRAIPAEIIDLIDVAVAVHLADRLTHRAGDYIYDIDVVLPLHCPDKFNGRLLLPDLEDILYWFTDDHWHFQFTQRKSAGRQMRMSLDYEESEIASEIALWSGGLDSLAGLCNRLVARPDLRFALVGVGSNARIHAIQQEVARKVRQRFPQRTKLIQVPIRSSSKAINEKNRRPRSRGFVFMLIGAVRAYLEGRDTLAIYENGVGAINLPYRSSEIGLDHSRAVHPISLAKVSHFISQVIEGPFTIHNPFLFWTKGQMCKVFAGIDAVNLIAHTHSCDRLRHEPRQCGNCSSCLLRRQALAARGIQDQTEYMAPTDLIHNEHSHLAVMLYQTRVIRTYLNTQEPWLKLSEAYPELADIAHTVSQEGGFGLHEAQTQILKLYASYVEEWESISNKVAQWLNDKTIPLLETNDRERSLPLWR